MLTELPSVGANMRPVECGESRRAVQLVSLRRGPGDGRELLDDAAALQRGAPLFGSALKLGCKSPVGFLGLESLIKGGASV